MGLFNRKRKRKVFKKPMNFNDAVINSSNVNNLVEIDLKTGKVLSIQPLKKKKKRR